MFEYQAAAAADVVYPPTGVAAGGTLVTVAGANFIASNELHGYTHGGAAQPGAGAGITLGTASDTLAGGVLRTSARPTLTDSAPPSRRVYMNIHPCGKS